MLRAKSGAGCAACEVFIRQRGSERYYRKVLPFIAWLVLFSLTPFLLGQDKKEKSKQPDTTVVGEARLWRDPGNISARDVFWGSGGEAEKPDTSKVTFVKEHPGGYSVKYEVRDGRDRKWVVKLGNEARPETTANRLLWAVGYVTELNYLVPCVHIKDAPKPRKDVKRCEGDGFADARFEARGEGVKRGENWAWKSNPFVGKRELHGLVVLMALLNNWDLKDENNVILQVTNADGSVERRYVISDLGATFGKTGGAMSHSRNEPEKYVKTKFVEGAKGDRVRFAFSGKQGELMDQVTVSDAKWIGGLLAQLSDQQLKDAFRAANFQPGEMQMLVAAVKDRINQLVSLPG
ncbi:MAG TPA: hypothetical protein VKD91_10855 [Pyrinomonadaceae bacterium]|nr:hypothetical protein [Pyrinomonadaceae bacterium]